MTERPNLVAGDAEGNPLEDTDHLVNGRVPGQGSGFWTDNESGELEPANGEPVDVPALRTDDQTINQSVTWPDGSTTATSPSGGTESEPRPSAYSAYVDVGEHRYGPSIVGSREQAWIRRLVGDSDAAGITSTSWVTATPDLIFGQIRTPPNKMPVLTLYLKMQSEDSGETMSVQVTTPHHGSTNPIFETSTGTGTATNEVFAERRLSGTKWAEASSEPYTEFAFRVNAKVSGGSTGGRIHKDSTLMLDYEVI